jgi:hypothetical protein
MTPSGAQSSIFTFNTLAYLNEHQRYRENVLLNGTQLFLVINLAFFEQPSLFVGASELKRKYIYSMIPSYLWLLIFASFKHPSLFVSASEIKRKYIYSMTPSGARSSILACFNSRP